MTDFESSFGKFTKSHFSNILVLFTIVTEQLTSLLAFECPCNPEYKLLYGLSYLLGPAVIVFLLALANQPLFWMVTTGCCYRRNDCFGESKSSCGKIFTTVLKSLNNALPAAMVWIIITLLKGDAYACAFWPYKSDLEPSVQVCEKNETILLPCQIPVTTGKNDFTTCNEQLARNLRAESHMIAFVYIALAGFFAFFGYVLHQCNGPYSYYQKSWIDSYTTTEHDVMQHKIQLRAKDLASELANEFLEQKRSKIEWDYISRVQSPKIVQHEMFPVDGKSDRKLVYTSLYEWAFQTAKGDEAKEDAFDYLERGEMTFNKERNPPPPETIHHLDVKLDEKLFEKLRIKKST